MTQKWSPAYNTNRNFFPFVKALSIDCGLALFSLIIYSSFLCPQGLNISMIVRRNHEYLYICWLVAVLEWLNSCLLYGETFKRVDTKILNLCLTTTIWKRHSQIQHIEQWIRFYSCFWLAGRLLVLTGRPRYGLLIFSRFYTNQAIGVMKLYICSQFINYVVHIL